MTTTTDIASERLERIASKANDDAEFATEELLRELRDLRQFAELAIVAVEAGNTLPAGFDAVVTAGRVASADAERIASARIAKAATL